ncbi:MAG TPA: helix-turn-helix domain-containing protein [Tepidiformaceae bacterium]|nr:helix-turn-helix domain-containing protein [Tepidiformaceae bacterium]HMO96908.1 helix-turn-helix domain-containing protein [Tepidiformaceae bacterium]
MARVSDAHLEARRQSILAAATKLFTQKGIAAATMAEIAEEAGISPGAIYRYFENKDELARGCMNHSADAIKNAWEHPEFAEMSFSALAEVTFAELNKPGDATDTQLFLERALVALRENDRVMLDEFDTDFNSIRAGIAHMMAAEYPGADEVVNVETLAEALLSFYWGSRLIKLLRPQSDAGSQLRELQKLIQGAFATGTTRS